MTNWDDIKKEWETTNITLANLAKKHDIKLGTLKSRKSRDAEKGEEWIRVATNNKKVATLSDSVATKKGAPKGNKNAVGNNGGAPKGNKNAVGNKGGAAPYRNKNAVTTGEYETIMWDYLDDEEKEIFESIETDPLFQIDITIRELTIRQRRMMKRIKNVENGLSEKQRRVLKQLRKVKEAASTYDEETGETKTVPIVKERLVTVEVDETDFRAIDDILSIEDALTRITKQLVQALKQKHDIEKSYSEQESRLELLQLKSEKIKADIAKVRSETKGTGGSNTIGVDLSNLTPEELRAIANSKR